MNVFLPLFNCNGLFCVSYSCLLSLHVKLFFIRRPVSLQHVSCFQSGSFLPVWSNLTLCNLSSTAFGDNSLLQIPTSFLLFFVSSRLLALLALLTWLSAFNTWPNSNPIRVESLCRAPPFEMSTERFLRFVDGKSALRPW